MKRAWPYSLMFCTLVCLLLLWRWFQDPVPLDRLQRLKAGMTQEEVVEILGAPTRVFSEGAWQYKRPFAFGYVNIHWMADGTYSGEYNYERF